MWGDFGFSHRNQWKHQQSGCDFITGPSCRVGDGFTQDAADGFARRFSIPHAHDSYDALWADDDVDVVYIASPHSHHHEMTIAALDDAEFLLFNLA